MIITHFLRFSQGGYILLGFSKRWCMYRNTYLLSSSAKFFLVVEPIKWVWERANTGLGLGQGEGDFLHLCIKKIAKNGKIWKSRDVGVAPPRPPPPP